MKMERDGMMTKQTKKMFAKVGGTTVAATLLTAGLATPTYAAEADQSQEAMDLYLDAQQNTNDIRWEQMLKYSETSIELQDRLLREAYKSNSSFSMGFDAEGDAVQPFLPQVQMAKNVLSKLEFETKSKIDPSTNEAYGDVDVNLNNFNIASAYMYQNEEKTALKVPSLYRKYFSFQNDKYGELIERLDGMSGMPAQETPGAPAMDTTGMMTSFPNIVKANETNFTFNELKTMGQDYLNVITDELEGAEFSLEEGVDYDGETYDKVSVQIDEEKAQEMIKALLEELKSDETFWNAVMQQMEMQGMPSDMNSEEMIMADLERAIENVDKLSLPEGISIEAYIQDNVVEHEMISMDLKAEGSEETVTVDMIGSFNKEGEDYEASGEISFGQAGQEEGFTLSYTEDGTSQTDGLAVDNEFRFVVDAVEDANDLTVGLNVQSDYTETTSNSTFDVVLEGDMFEGQPIPEIGGYVNTTLTKGSEDEYSQDTDLGLDLNFDNTQMGSVMASVDFNMEQDVTFTDDLEFPEVVEGDNAVNLNEVSDEELQKIGQDIQKNTKRYSNLFMQIFGETLFAPKK